jgi:hypothetical protein
MPHAPTPWVGLAALVAMFVIPMLPNWLFEGPRTVRHHPRRHICGLCSAPWTSHHDCLAELPEVVPSARGQLLRLDGRTALELGSQSPPPPTSPIQISPPGGNQLAQ